MPLSSLNELRVMIGKLLASITVHNRMSIDNLELQRALVHERLSGGKTHKHTQRSLYVHATLALPSMEEMSTA